jgi:hypothetical protein
VQGAVLTIRKDGTEHARTSDREGIFDFGSVDPGTWQLHIAPPAGFILADGERTPRPVQADSPGVRDLSVDLATADGVGRIRVWALADSAALAGVMVRVFDGHGAVVAKAETGGPAFNGVLFALPPGTYQVEAEIPAGYELSSDERNRSDDIVVRSGRLSHHAFSFRRKT